ncbi:MAG: asparagine synthase (glutamine-hydrolyzing), partial [Candidatus Sericytochromatia bacterium]|nr:asparagine synthase (glutamine-hydrolyzing) [Candidatus Tanganyikabacteria bacterium]
MGWIGAPEPDLLRGMLDRLTHRGPDSSGSWHDPPLGAWLGHRRLSILDLSPEGHQPMASPSGRYVVTYNGEVFNFKELRRELKASGVTFRGTSDTETIVAGFDLWGVPSTVERLVGMFAFGVFDRHTSTLWLGRDRLGIKPLYYTVNARQIAFSSELHALKGVPWLTGGLDLDALAAYFRYLCVPAPATILEGAHKLPSGHLLRWDGREAEVIEYWSLRDVARKGLSTPLTGSMSEVADELERRLKDAVKMRMVSDVPLGAFLSGGVDSSTVVALMQSQASQPIKTFTIGFEESSHDEAPFARAIAEHLGTDHHEQILTAKEAMDLIPLIASCHDEPFADASAVPTYLLSRFARQHVTVALSGDGGDELFGGYPRYFWAARIENLRQRLTPAGSRLLGRALAGVPAGLWDGPITRLGGWRYAGSDGLAARVRRLGGYLAIAPDSVYEKMLSAWVDPVELLDRNPSAILGPCSRPLVDLAWPERMMALDAENYLVDDILTKVDRASMAVSLEARVPLLDHRLVEWSWGVPRNLKLAPDGDRGKLVLREVLYRYVPRHLVERPKKGF